RPVHRGDAADIRHRPGGARGDTAGRADAARPGQHAFTRLPPGAARADAAGPWHLLDLARADVFRGRGARPGQLSRARPGRVRRDGPGRHHVCRRVPLSAPRARRYAHPNARGEPLLAAAADAGIRITLLDALYLTASVDGKPLEGVQLRF